MLVQSFLRQGGTLDRLASLYAIRAKRHAEHANLVLLKYNQIASPFAEPIVRECRGLILDEARDWECVSRGFDKFFNHGEGHAAQINWSTASVQEKVDGSLCVLYPYAGRWHVATTGTPDASGNIGPLNRPFASLFWEAWGLRRASDLDTGHVYFFELTSPHNRVVVRHDRTRLTALGGRSMRDGMCEFSAEAATIHHGVPAVRSFSLRGFDEIARAFNALSPLEHEGYVVVDHEFRRVKVKHPGYVALHHAKDGMTTRAFVEIARSGETSEVVAAFPEFSAALDDAKDRLRALIAEVEADYARLRGIETQKAFAFEALKTRCSAALFALRARKAPSAAEHLRGIHIDRLVELLGLRETVRADEEAA